MSTPDAPTHGVPSAPTEAERDEVLSLCAMASMPYDRFVWDTPARACEVAELLWRAGAGEVTAATSRVWRDVEGVYGVLVVMDGRELQRARLRGALALSRATDFALTAGERERAALAAPALLSVPADALYLARITVHPRARGRGVARAMMATLQASAAEHGSGEVWLEVEAANASAIALYRATGFVTLETVEVTAADDRSLRFVHMRVAGPSARPA